MNDMKLSEKLLWFWTLMVFGPANRRLWELSANYDSIAEFVVALRRGDVSQLSDKEREAAAKISPRNAKDLYDRITANGTKIYCYGSEGYPKGLYNTANPPAVLFVKGNLDFLDGKDILTVVGTREPSEYSEEVCCRFCDELYEKGVVTVAGMAKGIDTLVLKNAAQREAAAVGMFAKAFEDSNDDEKQLIDDVSKKGAVITEFFPGCRPGSRAFMNRNRIMIGMSDAVLFVQCARTSKGLDNYDKAVAQGKQVFVIPPRDIFDDCYSGQAELIRRGCKAVNKPSDVLREIGKRDLAAYMQSESEYTYMQDSAKPAPKIRKKKQSVVRETKDDSFDSLEGIQAQICEILKDGDLLADEIAAKTGADITDIMMELTELEMQGIVVSKAGKRYGLG